MNINIYEIKNSVKIYNSLTRKKEIFCSIYKNFIRIYICGPTVYDHLHLGNYRTFIIFDVIIRYFRHLGYKVCYVRNITDVGHLEINTEEDKIVKKSIVEGLNPMELAMKYTTLFHNAMDTLNIIHPNIEPTATGHIIEQIDIIQKIINNKLGYEMNGSVYFDLNKYNKIYKYGLLSNNEICELIKRNNCFSSEKKNFYDFCLWKKIRKGHIMKWNSPWGIGFPGWHTECTAMSIKYLGDYFDIHGGGIDLKFPHHECEIAQSNAILSGKNLARYWIHINMLTINGKKMSKSKINFIKLEDIFNKQIINSPNVFKLFILQTHYRNIINFSYDILKNTEKTYNKLVNSIRILRNFIPNYENIKSYFNVKNWIIECYKSINDDFNIPLLISNMLYVSNIIEKFRNEINIHDFSLLKKYMNHFFFDILGFMKENDEKTILYEKSRKFDLLLEKIISLRIKMRKNKIWEFSDEIRKELAYIGIYIQDKKL